MRDAFEHHPYGNDATGSATSVAAITRDDLAGFAASQFRRGGLVIGAVGDITATELATVIDLVFGGLPQGGGRYGHPGRDSGGRRRAGRQPHDGAAKRGDVRPGRA